MAEKIVMPQLGESVTEGTIAKWLVSVGDHVKKYDPICEVSTDKVNAEVPSSLSGTVMEIVAKEGETVAVGSIICYIAVEEEQTAPAAATPAAGGNEAKAEEEATSAAQKPTRYSPAVLRLAQEHQIDLSRISGSGAGGRITRKDVLDYLERGEKAIVDQPPVKPAPVPAAAEPKPAISDPIPTASAADTPSVVEEASAPAADIPLAPGDQIIPLTNIRRTIAGRMVQSKHEAPHAWTMVECDATNLVNFRNRIKDEFKQKEGISLTFLPFFIKAVVEALKEFPILNSQWGGDKIIVKKGIHISIAVATEDALYVPVMKDADQKSIYGIARAVDDLVRKTKSGKLTLDDLTGGTFTVNNTGSFGSVLSTPIINPPQAAILSIEAIVKRPVIINDMIAIRDMVNICLSLDHRILDGLVCGRFLQSVKQKIESLNSDTNIY